MLPGRADGLGRFSVVRLLTVFANRADAEKVRFASLAVVDGELDLAPVARTCVGWNLGDLLVYTAILAGAVDGIEQPALRIVVGRELQRKVYLVATVPRMIVRLYARRWLRRGGRRMSAAGRGEQ